MTKKRRADSYFGLHFDFHANERLTGIGTRTKAENIDRLLETVKPDFLQVDTKGHPGYASFVTACGNTAPGLEANHLEIFRKETEKYGVALYGHYDLQTADPQRKTVIVPDSARYLTDEVKDNLRRFAENGVI